VGRLLLKWQYRRYKPPNKIGLSHESYNWHQLMTVILDNGFHEIRNPYSYILLFEHPDGRTIEFNKSNRMSPPFVATILRRAGIDNTDFIQAYRQAYRTRPVTR
jgi:hypothetical protein